MNILGWNLGDKDIAGMLLDQMASDDFLGLDPSALEYDPRVQAWKSCFANAPLPAIHRVWRSVVSRTIYYAGYKILASIIKPPMVTYSKAMGLNLSTIACLWHTSSPEQREALSVTAERLDGLLQAKRLFDEDLWTHDVNFYIGDQKVAARVPVLVTTAFVALGYRDYWIASQSSQARERFIRIASAMHLGIPFKQYGDRRCYMYTSQSNYHVHNANLLMAEVLALWHATSPEPGVFTAVYESIKYSVDHFRATGSFPYAGPETPNSGYDNYHTGYVLRSLANVAEVMPSIAKDLGLSEIIDEGVRFYINKFVHQGLVRKNPRRTIETHSLAESVLILKRFRVRMTRAQVAMLTDAIRLTADMLWLPKDSYFINNIKPIFGGAVHLKDRSNQIRWSQSWMAYALAAPESPA